MADPVGQRGAIQIDAPAGVNLGLAVERQMVFAHQGEIGPDLFLAWGWSGWCRNAEIVRIAAAHRRSGSRQEPKASCNASGGGVLRTNTTAVLQVTRRTRVVARLEGLRCDISVPMLQKLARRKLSAWSRDVLPPPPCIYREPYCLAVNGDW